jgi:hypothetical protein
MYPTRPKQPQQPIPGFGGMPSQMPMGGMPQMMGGIPTLSMPQQAQGTPNGLPFMGQQMQPQMQQMRPQMPQQAWGGQGILSGGGQFPQAPRTQMDPQRLAMILQMLSRRR